MPNERNERNERDANIPSIGVTIIADTAAEPSPAYLALWRRLLAPVPVTSGAADAPAPEDGSRILQDECASHETEGGANATP